MTHTELLQLLRDIEWSGERMWRDGGLSGTCPECTGVHPRYANAWDTERGANGHRADCRLLLAIGAVEQRVRVEAIAREETLEWLHALPERARMEVPGGLWWWAQGAPVSRAATPEEIAWLRERGALPVKEEAR